MNTVVKLPRDLEEVETNLYLNKGRYILELTKGEIKKGPNADYVCYTVAVFDKGKILGTLVENVSLAENALWKLKRLINALGLEAKGKTFDFSKLLGIKFLGDIIETEFESRSGNTIKKNEISDYLFLENKPNSSTQTSKAAPPPQKAVKEKEEAVVDENDFFDDDAI